MLKVAVLAKEQRSLSSLIISKRLNLLKLASQRGLDLHKHVKVGVKVSNNTEEISILSSQFPLGGLKVSKGKVAVGNLLVGVVQSVKKVLVRLVSRGLGTHDFISGGSGISTLINDLGLVLVNLSLHLAKLVNLFSHLLDSILVDVVLFNVLAQLADLILPLLVQLNLSMSGTSSLIETLTKLFNFPGKVRSLSLSLCTGLALSLKFFFHFLNTSLIFLDV